MAAPCQRECRLKLCTPPSYFMAMNLWSSLVLASTTAATKSQQRTLWCRQLVGGMATQMDAFLGGLVTHMQTAGLEAERVQRICQQVCHGVKRGST